MTTDMTLDQIIWDLNYCDNEFPAAAFEAARQQRDAIIPRLIEILEEATKDANDDVPVMTWGHIAAMFLLTEFDVKEAFPAILDAMCSLDASRVYGDARDSFAPIAARLADGPEMLAEKIDSEDVDDFVRGSLVRAVFGMVCDAKISREQGVSFLREWLTAAIEYECPSVVTACVESLGNLLAEEAREDIENADELELIHEEMIGPDYFSNQLAKGATAFEEARDDYRRAQQAMVDDLRMLQRFEPSRTDTQSLDSVLEEICQPFETFPSDAVRWARKHPEEMMPHLIRILEDLPETAAEGDPQMYAHIIALFLLTEYDAKESLPVILDLLDTSDVEVVNSLAPVLEGELAQMLGRFADSPDQLAVLIDNPELDANVVREAVEAIVWMVTENKCDRDSAIGWLLARFEKSRQQEDVSLAGSLAQALSELGATEALESVVDAVNLEELDLGGVEEFELMEGFNNGLETFADTQQRHKQLRIVHTVVQIESWPWDMSNFGQYEDDDDPEDLDEEDFEVEESFQSNLKSLLFGRSESEIARLMKNLSQMQAGDMHEIDGEDDSHDPDVPVRTIRNASQKVGRNDSCPCGSGRKYKKCCAKLDE